MKHTIAYYVLLLYAVAACKPILPAARDFIAHAFNSSGHISTVHHTHGNDHVHAEYQKQLDSEKTEQEKTSKYADPVSIHLIVDDHHLSSLFSNLKLISQSVADRTSAGFISYIAQPPRQ